MIHVVCLVHGPEFCPVSLCPRPRVTDYELMKKNRGIILEADTQKGQKNSSSGSTMAFDKIYSQV